MQIYYLSLWHTSQIIKNAICTWTLNLISWTSSPNQHTHCPSDACIKIKQVSLLEINMGLPNSPTLATCFQPTQVPLTEFQLFICLFVTRFVSARAKTLNG